MTREGSAPQTSPPEFRFGEGRIAGTLALVLGALSLLAVLCFRYPALLTTPELRAVLPLPLARGILLAAILLSCGLGLLAALLGAPRRLVCAGLGSAAAATLLGGAWVETPEAVASRQYLGLDWFVLDLLLLALLFVPLERWLALRREQRVFRAGWRTDLAHFAVSHLLVQAVALLTVAPATLLLGGLVLPGVQRAIASQPAALQFVQIVFVADLFQYWTHRLFHAQPRLWRFHAVHHSSRELDWLAGSRLHLVDVVATRAASFAPLFLLGFAQGPLVAYLVFVSFHAVAIHANVGLRLRWLRGWLVTPAYHHWHHAAEPEARDRNFAVHLPLFDRLFGTLYLPERWPAAYGIEGEPVPETWPRQLVWPFR
jgi:lathosterol oxidase